MTRETKRATVVIKPPTVSDKEKALLLREIAQIKKHW